MAQAKRFKRISCTDKQLSASDGVYFYYGVGTRQAKRVSFADRDDNTAGTLGYDFGAGLSISDMFADTRQPGIVYAVVETTSTGKYSVHRSSDSAPDAEDFSGFQILDIKYHPQALVQEGAAGLWARSQQGGMIYVQEA